jgi:lipase chaperone LimK
MLRGLIGRLRCREQYGLSDEEWRQAILACVREAAAC